MGVQDKYHSQRLDRVWPPKWFVVAVDTLFLSLFNWVFTDWQQLKEKACTDQACPLGKWLYWETHKKFHKQVHNLLQLAESDPDKANNEFLKGDVPALSLEIQKILNEMQQKKEHT